MSTLRLRLVRELDEFQALHQAWNSALDESPDKHIFLTWEWLFTWWKHFGKGRQLNIVVVEDDGQIVAVAPFMRSSFGFGVLGVEGLESISYDTGDYGGFVIREGNEEAVALLATYLKSEIARKNTVAVVSRVADDSNLVAFFRKRLQSSQNAIAFYEQPSSVCPYYEATQSDVVRIPRTRDLPRQYKRLNTDYEVGFTYHTEGDLTEAMETLFRLHRMRWATKTKKMAGMFSDAKKRAFSTEVVNALNQRGLVRLSFLTADENTISGALCFEYGNRFYYLRPAFDPNYSQYSPGHMHIFHLLRESVSRGVTEFDFLRGPEPYKMVWANSRRKILTVLLTRPGVTGKAHWFFFRLMRKLGRAIRGR